MVLARAELADGPAAQREVHACLDGHRVVAEGEALERGHELARLCNEWRGERATGSTTSRGVR